MIDYVACYVLQVRLILYLGMCISDKLFTKFDTSLNKTKL
jgi:hypothetical protein